MTVLAATATWIENWPPAVQALSFRQQGMQLSLEQTHALGRRNGVLAQRFATVNEACLLDLQAGLDAAFREFPGGAFVRLGSRSPKDTPLGVLTGCRADTGVEALRLLTDGSRRVFHDLRTALQLGLRPWVFLREWRDLPWAAELRCFLRAGQLVGISQYHCRDHMSAPDRQRAERSVSAIEQLAGLLRRELGAKSLVFDVCVSDNEPPGATLIEINPWGAPTEGCLFDWTGVFDGSLRLT